MKRVIAFAIVLLVALAGLYFAERKTRQSEVSPNAVVNMAADWQRDITRLPMRETRLSDTEETRIGDELAKQYEQTHRPFTPEQQALQRYIRQVGGRVAARAQRKLAYRFHLVSSAYLINAFALPGGHVFVGQGLLDQMTSEDELGFVLGHEIEHIDHYHAAERVQVEAQLKHLNLDVVAAIAEIPMSLWQAGYTKQEEFEADREGLRVAVAAGYSAQGAVKMLDHYVKLYGEYVTHAESPSEELGKVAIQGLEGYFRSHPLPAERLAQVKDVTAREHLASPALKPFRIEYEVKR